MKTKAEIDQALEESRERLKAAEEQVEECARRKEAQAASLNQTTAKTFTEFELAKLLKKALLEQGHA